MTGRLAQVVRCARCGDDYRAFTPAQARARWCPSCEARASAFAEAAAALMAAAVLVSVVVVLVVLWR